MQTNNRLRSLWNEGANTRAVRSLMIGLAALVVLSVSGYGTVIYIQLMSKVFASGGPLLIACYMGAAANLLLMLVLLVGKFVWFRPGAHEVASWIVTGVEMSVAILNMMLAYELANGQHLASLMAAWYYLAPISPVFSMCGAIVLIMTSTELRRKHHALEIEERKEQSERDFDMALHDAQMDVKHQYLGFVKTNLVSELNAPERQLEMKNHASVLVSEVLSHMSGMASVPQFSHPALPPPAAPPTASVFAAPSSVPPVSHRPSVVSPADAGAADEFSHEDDAWLTRANERIEQAREQRLRQTAAAVRPASSTNEGADTAAWQQVTRTVLEMLLQHPGAVSGLERAEQFFGLSSSSLVGGEFSSLPLASRVGRVVVAVREAGYDPTTALAFLGRFFRTDTDERGDDSAKKTVEAILTSEK